MRRVLILLTFLMSAFSSLADELPILSDRVIVIDTGSLRASIGDIMFSGGTKLADLPALDLANAKIGEPLDLRLGVNISEKLKTVFPSEIHLLVTIDHSTLYILYTDEAGSVQLQATDGDARNFNYPFMVIDEYSPTLDIPVYTGAFDVTGMLQIEPIIKLANGRLLARAGSNIKLQINSNQASQLEGEFVAKSDFLPNPNGFGFPNSLVGRDTDYSTADMIKLLGQETACYTAPDGSCVLKAWVEQLRKSYISEVREGVCYGMSVSSMMLNRGIELNGKSLVSDYQAGASNTIDLQSEAVRDMILFFQKSQSAPNVDAYIISGDKVQKPSEVLQAIIDGFNSDDPIASLNVIQEGEGGHSVMPYAVQAGENGDFRVYVYDNNFPDDASQFAIINPELETWRYVAKLNPTTPAMEFSGDLSNIGMLSAIPLSEKLNLSPLAIDDATAEFKFAGIGLQMLIENDNGKRIGYDFDTNLHINEIDGAEIVPNFSLGAPPSYKVPVILPTIEEIEEIDTPEKELEARFKAMFEVALGAVNADATNSSFFMQYDDSIVEIGNINLSTGEGLSMAVSPFADMVGIASDKIANQSLIVKLTVDVETEATGMIYEISDLKLVANTGIMLFVNQETAELGAISFPIKEEEEEIEDSDFVILDASSYNLRVYKNSAAGRATARRANITLPVGSINKMQVEAWDNFNLRSVDSGSIKVEQAKFDLWHRISSE
jgi:hypothetical protein